MHVQGLEKENSLLSQEKVGAIKMWAELRWCIMYRSQLRASSYHSECLVLQSLEDKAGLIDVCQARVKYLGKVQRGRAECAFRDELVGIQIRAEKVG